MPIQEILKQLNSAINYADRVGLFETARCLRNLVKALERDGDIGSPQSQNPRQSDLIH